jgi:hypothetical protein
MNIQQIQLNAVRAYIDWVRKLYPTEEAGAASLIMVMQIYEWHLRRYQLKSPATLDELSTLKHGIREAEILIHAIHDNEPSRMQGWYLGCNPANQAQSLCSLLWQLVMSLAQEIVETEGQHPALKPMFDRERAEYRRMKTEAERTV